MSSAVNTTPGYVGGWEKVGKGGHAKQGGHNNNGKAKFTKNEKKKFAEKAPKLEEVRE